MNAKDRKAWDLALANTLPPHPNGVTSRIVMPGLLLSKANQHEVHFHPAFWQQIRFLAELWRKEHRSSPFWVAPSDATRAYEEALAYRIKQAEPYRLSGPLALDVGLYGQGLDIDNIKAVADAVQQSGLIKNDNQFSKLTVERFAADAPRIELVIQKR